MDIENWDRKESYLFFKDFKDPFVGITVELDATSIWEFSRANSLSIHHALLYCTLSAANKYLPMRLRRQGDGVVEPGANYVRWNGASCVRRLALCSETPRLLQEGMR